RSTNSHCCPLSGPNSDSGETAGLRGHSKPAFHLFVGRLAYAPRARLTTKGRNMIRRSNPIITKACPTNCSGGYESQQRSLFEGQMERMPADILETAKGSLQYCRYCHAVWGYVGDFKKLYGYLEDGEFERCKGS